MSPRPVRSNRPPPTPAQLAAVARRELHKALELDLERQRNLARDLKRRPGPYPSRPFGAIHRGRR